MRTDSSPLANGSRLLRSIVAELARRPMIDAGCCALPAEVLICDSLATVPGLRAVGCDSARGEVRLELDPDTEPLPLMRTVLDGLGYPVTEVRR